MDDSPTQLLGSSFPRELRPAVFLSVLVAGPGRAIFDLQCHAIAEALLHRGCIQDELVTDASLHYSTVSTTVHRENEKPRESPTPRAP